MFANRFTAFMDACVLAGVLKRNLLLTLAEAEFFRLRWSRPVLDETERAIESILVKKGSPSAKADALRARGAMERAFEDAMVGDFDDFLCVCAKLPDAGDKHVVAAALKTQAAVIVTDNLKHFPLEVMAPLNMDVLSADAFIADTIALHEGRAVAAIRAMRQRFNNPAVTPDQLIVKLEASSLTETADVLRPYVQLL